jgi:hypothetical protein
MKNNKSGKPADGLTPEARHADNVKYNNQRSHLTAGDGLIPASQNDGLSPEDRAASRHGTDYERSSKAHNYNKSERSKVSKALSSKKDSTVNSGSDQSEARVGYSMKNSTRGSDPKEVRASGPAHKAGLEVRTTTWARK